MRFLFALSSAGLNALAAVMALGLLIGVFGHIVRSRTWIITGIVVIGAASVYFAFVVARVR